MRPRDEPECLLRRVPCATAHGKRSDRLHGRLAQPSAVHHPMRTLHVQRFCHVGLHASALLVAVLQQTGGTSFRTRALAQIHPGSIFSRPSASHSLQTPMSIPCDEQRRWVALGRSPDRRIRHAPTHPPLAASPQLATRAHEAETKSGVIRDPPGTVLD
jgi:hypothetical protein